VIKSMTGTATAYREKNGIRVRIDIKSLNHRYFEFALYSGKEYLILEDYIRRVVARFISRGKINIYLKIYEEASDSISFSYNSSLMKKLIALQTELSDKYNINTSLSLKELFSIPGIMVVDRVFPDETFFKKYIEPVLITALKKLVKMRKFEGKMLAKDIRSRLKTINSYLKKIEKEAKKVKKEYENNYFKKFKNLSCLTEEEKNRIYTEIAVYIDKTDITEEIVRAYSHLAQIKDLLKRNTEAGKKLDFLLQEIFREITTISYKSGSKEISKLAVEIKHEVEKLREQARNIE